MQRVKRADVVVDGETVGQIGHGLLIYLGIHKDDDMAKVRYLAPKVAKLRLFQDDAGKMNRSLIDTGGEALVISQFTLYGDCSSGLRPDFFSAMPAKEAVLLYESFVSELKREIKRVETGRFQAYMQVSSVNDGPVTLMVEAP
nr:D-aminoacyl-tRNA deacylase [Estrella lausannensis]